MLFVALEFCDENYKLLKDGFYGDDEDCDGVGDDEVDVVTSDVLLATVGKRRSRCGSVRVL